MAGHFSVPLPIHIITQKGKIPLFCAENDDTNKNSIKAKYIFLSDVAQVTGTQKLMMPVKL